MKEFTPEQQKWIEDYEHHTGFDVIISEEDSTFEKIAQWNVDWYESHANETLRRISNFPKSVEYYASLY